MQRGSLVKAERKNGPDVWQFRWSEKGGDGRRVYRKRVIGTIEQYSDAGGAKLPPGKYLIHVLDNTDLDLMEIRGQTQCKT